jgi:hypothetical protein
MTAQLHCPLERFQTLAVARKGSRGHVVSPAVQGRYWFQLLSWKVLNTTCPLLLQVQTPRQYSYNAVHKIGTRPDSTCFGGVWRIREGLQSDASSTFIRCAVSRSVPNTNLAEARILCTCPDFKTPPKGGRNGRKRCPRAQLVDDMWSEQSLDSEHPEPGLPSTAAVIAAAASMASASEVEIARRRGSVSSTMFSAPGEDFLSLCRAQLQLARKVLGQESSFTVSCIGGDHECRLKCKDFSSFLFFAFV